MNGSGGPHGEHRSARHEPAPMGDRRVAVLDDWQRVARACADWAPLERQADVQFFTEPFASEDEAATALAGFDIILALRERTPFPRSLVDRLPNLKMFGLTGVRAGKIELAYMQQRGSSSAAPTAAPASRARLSSRSR